MLGFLTKFRADFEDRLPKAPSHHESSNPHATLAETIVFAVLSAGVLLAAC